jgi:hypothetical protein
VFVIGRERLILSGGTVPIKPYLFVLFHQDRAVRDRGVIAWSSWGRAELTDASEIDSVRPRS